MEDRLMAGIVDMALVLIAFLLFVLVFVACTTHPPAGKPALMYVAIALVSFFTLYRWLFFTYADGTPRACATQRTPPVPSTTRIAPAAPCRCASRRCFFRRLRLGLASCGR
jgi:hypothetical protein